MRNGGCEGDSQRPPIDGFQPQLVAHGQGAHVYRHIQFFGGNGLLGPFGESANLAEYAYDLWQRSRGRQESIAEVADDEAGFDVGRALREVTRTGDFKTLRDKLRKILCK